MAEKKHSAFALLNILVEFTDENHILTAKELMELLEQKYNLKIERRTLYSNIDILEQAGYVISKYDDNGRGYFLEKKQFDKAEILLLCNAIHASHFISSDQSNTLIKKLLKTQSKYDASDFIDDVYLPNTLKTNNRELLYTLFLIYEAFQSNKMMQFQYLKYDENKKMVPKRKEPYVVEPRYIVFEGTTPYLVATNPKYADYTHYRVDKMKKAILIEQQMTPLAERDSYEYSKDKLYMFSGELIPVRYLCDKQILDQMIDIFGRDVTIVNNDEDHFVLCTRTTRRGAKLLAQQFMDSIRIMEPEDLKKDFINDLTSVLSQYKQ